MHTKNSFIFFRIIQKNIYTFLLCTGSFDFCKRTSYIAMIMLQTHAIDLCNNEFAPNHYCFNSKLKSNFHFNTDFCNCHIHIYFDSKIYASLTLLVK